MEFIIYEDAQLLLVHKPAGIPVQTKSLSQKDMVSILKNYRAQKGEEPYIAVVHRLDQPVEGLLLLARTAQAAAQLSEQFQKRMVDKYYRAVVYNERNAPLSAGESGRLTDYLWKDPKQNLSMAVSEGTKGARKAVLQYRVLKTKDRFAELSVLLETGRHHQIRVQMANAGLPLAGDLKYGWTGDVMFQGTAKHPALCADQISFIHPITKQKMEFHTKPQNPIFQLLQEHPDISS
ncbi:MAG: RluA family pseudouridine synthase [Eubacterium sp.]|jgi:23S rRNA pseudouridine1911/1915/1917 synthase|nr:RluA family pseudouridine synthase [Eubacterium sp.]